MTRFDEGIPGGQYLVAGKLVNANGEPITEEPAEKAVPPPKKAAAEKK